MNISEKPQKGDTTAKKPSVAPRKQERKPKKSQETSKQNVNSDQNATTNKNVLKPGTKPVEVSEKEKRRLEWEKKLAEQKKNEKGDEGLSKAQLKEKRREQQELQRKAKEQKPEVEDKKQEETPKVPVLKPAVKKSEPKRLETGKLPIVNHLYDAKTLKKAQYENFIVNFKNVHPAFVRLGVQYKTKRILGSNARCLSFLSALKYLIEDIQVPPKQEFCRYLELILQSCVAYLTYCRPLAVSMSNALRYFKIKLREATKKEDNEKKYFLQTAIDTYITDEIDKAGEAITLKVKEKITKGDIILTYSCSSLIYKILQDAHNGGTQFQVIVVDGRPFLEGRQMLQRLVQIGIQCSYVHINALSCVMKTVSKVLLGSHALLTNGYVMSRIGTAQVALVAQAFNIPVLVCCETYKFSERVQTDSIICNELGDADMLKSVDVIEEDSPLVLKNDVNITNLLYDLTPPDLVTAVVTEIAILPCTSVPVVLRVKPTEFV